MPPGRANQRVKNDADILDSPAALAAEDRLFAGPQENARVRARYPFNALTESILKKLGEKSHMFLNPDT